MALGQEIGLDRQRVCITQTSQLVNKTKMPSYLCKYVPIYGAYKHTDSATYSHCDSTDSVDTPPSSNFT